jgi:hypothetical protein
MLKLMLDAALELVLGKCHSADSVRGAAREKVVGL